MVQNLDPTLRGAITQDAILVAIVDRLREEIDDYTDQNCWESDDPVPLTHAGGDEFCTVSFGAGQFPEEFFTGGGSDTLTEVGSIIIAPSVPVRGDRPRRRKRRLIGSENSCTESQSLLGRKLAILKALFRTDWEPAAGLKPLLRDLPHPTRCTAPVDVHVGETKFSQLQIVIQTTFDWDLS